MCKKIISHLLIFSLLLSGCYSWEVVQAPEGNSKLRITTKNDEQFVMDPWQETEVSIIGHAGEIKKDGDKILKLRKIINKSNIAQFEIKKRDDLATIILSIAVATIITSFIVLRDYSYPRRLL